MLVVAPPYKTCFTFSNTWNCTATSYLEMPLILLRDINLGVADELEGARTSLDAKKILEGKLKKVALAPTMGDVARQKQFFPCDAHVSFGERSFDVAWRKKFLSPL